MVDISCLEDYTKETLIEIFGEYPKPFEGLKASDWDYRYCTRCYDVYKPYFSWIHGLCPECCRKE